MCLVYEKDRYRLHVVSLELTSYCKLEDECSVDTCRVTGFVQCVDSDFSFPSLYREHMVFWYSPHQHLMRMYLHFLGQVKTLDDVGRWDRGTRKVKEVGPR